MTHSKRFPGARRQIQGIHDRISEQLNVSSDDGKLPEGWYETTWDSLAVPHLKKALNSAKNALMAHDLGQPDLPSVDEAITHFATAAKLAGENLSQLTTHQERAGHWEGQPRLSDIGGKLRALHYHHSRYKDAIQGRLPVSPEDKKLGRQFDEIIGRNFTKE